MKLYTAEVVADSISPEGQRITSVKVVYPHAVHKDMLRHRAHNRNVESFRAQPPEILIRNLMDGQAFIPDVFAKRVKGMGQSSEATPDQHRAQYLWREHITNCVTLAEAFLEMDIAKQQVNFVLQDLCPLTEIITATDWSNFFALRMELDEEGRPIARPEVFKTAEAIYKAINGSTPQELKHDWLHLPMITEAELSEICRRREMHPPGTFEVEGYWVHVSAGRCARISFGDYQWWNEKRDVSYTRAVRLLGAGHMSPFEQQAKPFSEPRWNLIRHLQREIRADEFHEAESSDMQRQLEYCGNLRGWVPARKTLPNEWDYSLIKKAVA